MSAPSLTLTVVPQQTSLDCSWTLSDASFASISSAVLTYTDVSGNVWRTKNVSYEGRSVSRDSIVDLVSDTQYAVFLTLRGLLNGGGTTTTTLVSNTVINRTGKIPDRPFITLLSGADYIQVLFTSQANNDTSGHSTDIGNSPYDFTLNEVKNVVVSYNQIRTGTADYTGQTGARDFNVTNGDIKTHTFNDISGASMSYNYILVTGLSTEVGYEYEVAAVYYNDYGPGEVSATKKIGVNNTGGRDDTDSAQNKAFISYALNDAGDAVDELYPLGGSPIKINVKWLNPFFVTGDTLADLEMEPKSIQRLKWTNDVSGNDGGLVTLTSGNFLKEGSIYTYVDTYFLNAGETYSYIIAVETADGSATKTSETNKVVALTTTTVVLAAANLVLDPLDGSIKLDAAFTDIVTYTGGFSVGEFGNNDFKLKYMFDDEVPHEKTISIVSGRVSCDHIMRTDGQQKLQYARIESKPVHNTVYIDSWDPAKTQSLYYSKNTSDLDLTGTEDYNTTFPQAVTGFAYTNATVAGTTAAESFTLTWDDTDISNNSSAQYYRVIATKNTNVHLTIVLSKTDVSTDVTADKYVTITGGSVTFDVGTDAFFATGNDYKFSIQRGYVHKNTITTKPSDSVVVDKVSTNELLYGAINSGTVELRMFSNPPAPVISLFTFNELTGVLGFKLEYNQTDGLLGNELSDYGFSQANTKFRVQVEVDGSIVDALTDTYTEAQNQATVDMSTVAVGKACTLRVQEYVYTKYTSTDLSANFYSEGSTKEFVREGPLAAPTSVISFNSVSGSPLEDDMEITWDPKNDTAATALSAPIYYEMVVTDSTSSVDSLSLFLLGSDDTDFNKLFHADATMNNQNITLTTGKEPYYTSDPLPFFVDSSGASVTYGTASSKKTVTLPRHTIGKDYSYKIRSVYYDTNFTKYVYSDYATTARSLRSFKRPPQPLIKVDVETANTELGVTTAYGPNANLEVCGFDNDDISFEYVWNSPLTGGATLTNTGYNSIANQEVVTLGQKIPISFYTYVETIASSDVTTTSKFRSIVVDNATSINGAVYTTKPQIKWLNVVYADPSCNIIVNVEPNGTIITEVVLVANTYNNTGVLTSQTIHNRIADTSTDGLDNLGESHPSENDQEYSYILSNVNPNGLDSITIVVHTAVGLSVVSFPSADNNVLHHDPTGSFVPAGRINVQVDLSNI
jgi:hypothetical protein